MSTTCNPLIQLYFDPALYTAARSHFGGSKQERRIGSLASSAVSTASIHHRKSKKKMNHFASRVSHYDQEMERGWEALRAADAESRAKLTESLFGEGAAAPTKEEEKALKRYV
jgi:hypothetical protein